MWIIFGTRTSFRDMGTVAEYCPHCRAVVPCAVTGRVEEVHFYFLLTLVSNTTAASCTCGACGGQFPVEQRQYRGFVSADDAPTLPIETLLEQTNPSMIEQLQWLQRRQQFADDSDFTVIAETAEQLGAGRQHAKLAEGLQQWDLLDYRRRVELMKLASDLARALRFARTLPAQVPGISGTGCSVGALTCLGVWSTFVGLSAAGGLFRGALAAFVGVMAGPLLGIGVVHWLQRRRFRLWAEEVFIPEAESAGIDFAQLAAIMRDLPVPGPTSTDDLRPLREHAETLVKLLVASGKVERTDDGIDQC